MTSLKFLAVARNRIKVLPFALGDMPNLHKLKFDEKPDRIPSTREFSRRAETAANLSREAQMEACSTVKRYLRATGTRQRMRDNSEEELR